VTQQNKTIK